jgi:hypothetical protein
MDAASSEPCRAAPFPGGAAASAVQDGPGSSTFIREHEAVQIFLCRPKASEQTRSFETASLARALGQRYGVTGKAIRDIWNRRSWAWATRAHWTAREAKEELQSVLCKNCRLLGIQNIEDACATCAVQGAVERCYRQVLAPRAPSCARRPALNWFIMSGAV